MTQVFITEQNSTIVVKGNGTHWNYRVVSFEGDCYAFWHNFLEEGTSDQMVEKARKDLANMHLYSIIEIVAISPADWKQEDWQTIDERHWYDVSGYPEGCYPDNDYGCWDVEVEQYYCDRTSVEYYRFVGTKLEALSHFAGFNRKVTVTPTTMEAWEAEDYAASWWEHVDVVDSDIDEYAEALTERYTEDDNYLPF